MSIDPAELTVAERGVLAYDVMMWRGWGVVFSGGKWHVPAAHCVRYSAFGPDPFTALVRAARWYKENVEKQP